LLILDDLARCGYLDSSQIAREHFHSHDRALHRLRQLVDARLLNATLVSSRRPNLLSCTRQAFEALTEHGFATMGLRLPPVVRSSAVEHLLLVNDVRLYCAALATVGYDLLEWNSGRSQDARTAALKRHGLIPDGIAVIECAAREQTIFVEADCGHETADLEEKLERYAKVLPQPNSELWLVCIGDRSRLRSIARMCAKAGLLRWTRLAERQHVTARPARAVPLLLQALEDR
jgi:hypothetical protein